MGERNRDRELMELAINLASGCDPVDPDRIPKVGAVIAIGGTVLGTGRRDNGSTPAFDDHAEFNALANVDNKALLHEATVYTTLEPCTHHIRTKKEEACTELLAAAQVRKVFIGILDPNQGVCGKGAVELQNRGIEVELFPHDLAQRIRNENARFIRAQQTLGIRFLPLEKDGPLETFKTGGQHTFNCECINPPGSDIFVFTNRDGEWWPQPHPLRQVEQSNIWEAVAHFGAYGAHTIHVVKANELGMQLIGYYRKIVRMNVERQEALKRLKIEEQDVKKLRGGYPGIPMPRLPKGLDSQAVITVEIAKPPEEKK
jgi:pyrimidine deaminase RibD-like protein